MWKLSLCDYVMETLARVRVGVNVSMVNWETQRPSDKSEACHLLLLLRMEGRDETDLLM